MHQCPKCELRFRSRDELNDHLVRDHRVPPEDLPTRRASSG